MNKAPRKEKRIRNPVVTRAKLLQATIDLVSEKGAEALSLKEAARRANVSRGAAYLHFNDRDHLLHEAKDWISHRRQEAVRRLEGASLHDRTLHTIRLVLDHREASKLMITAALSGEHLDRSDPFYKLISRLLRELRTGGQVPQEFDLEIMTYIMFGSIAAAIMFGEQHKQSDTGELAERFTKEWNRILRAGMFVRGKSGNSRRPGRSGEAGRQAQARASATSGWPASVRRGGK